MRTYSVDHLSDAALEHGLEESVSRESQATAVVLACLAEFEERKRFLAAAFPSMLDYCVQKLGYSREAAKKRIRAARTARRFPVLFESLAQRRLHLSSIVLLAAYLTAENADDLIAAALDKSTAQLERLLAERFPRTESLALVEAVPGSAHTNAVQGSPGTPIHEGSPGTPRMLNGNGTGASRVEPIAAQRYALHVSVDQGTHDLLVRAQKLLSHAVPSGDLGEVVKRGLELLVRQLEKRRIAKTDRPRPSRGASGDVRGIPAEVRRAVWARDGEQCTYRSDTGERCAARRLLELDHVIPVAVGGPSTVENLRLRCRGHNGYEAERIFGASFMQRKLEEARRERDGKRAARAQEREEERAARAREREADAAERRARIEAREQAAAERREKEVEEKRANAAAKGRADEIVPCLRHLGFRADEARQAAEFCEGMPDAPVEDRIRAAIQFLRPKTRYVPAAGAA